MKKLLTFAIFSFTLPALAATPNISGHYAVHLSIAGNESDQDCVLAVADGKISGSCSADDKNTPLKGTVDGNNVTWTIQSEANGAPLTLTYKAKVDVADKFAGTVDVQPYGVSGDFTATAVPAKTK